MAHFACKVEKFRNQLKFCNQILERHNFVHLIKLCNTSKGKHFKQKFKKVYFASLVNYTYIPCYNFSRIKISLRNEYIFRYWYCLLIFYKFSWMKFNSELAGTLRGHLFDLICSISFYEVLCVLLLLWRYLVGGWRETAV